MRGRGAGGGARDGGGGKLLRAGAMVLEHTSSYVTGHFLRYEKMIMLSGVGGGGSAAAAAAAAAAAGDTAASKDDSDAEGGAVPESNGEEAFRDRMIISRKGNARDGQCFLFRPTLSNGNCGFLTIALALNRRRRTHYGSHDIRRILRDEVHENRQFYVDEAESNPVCRLQMDDDVDFDDFESSVMKGGWSGHWLGERWGMLEIKIIARALKLHIELFCFDPKTMSLRSYHSEDYGEDFVGMFFSGHSHRGHFDLLLRHPSVR